MKIEARAYAKINWLLEVGGARPDGYHELRTLFQTVDLYDELSFEESDGLHLEISDAGCPSLLKADDSNLVMKAARALQKKAGINCSGARIRLDKRIPVGAGLGGGSSDAAAALTALNELWRSRLSLAELAEIGAEIGSDVPFFFTGGTAWGRGRGTQILPAEDIEAPFLLLVNPRIEVSTPAAYHAFDELTNFRPEAILATCSFLNADALFNEARNSLSQAVGNLYPAVAEVERRLCELGGRPVLMSGSGATVWARFSSQEEMKTASEALKPTDWLVVETRAIGRDEYLRSMLKIAH